MRHIQEFIATCSAAELRQIVLWTVAALGDRARSIALDLREADLGSVGSWDGLRKLIIACAQVLGRY